MTIGSGLDALADRAQSTGMSRDLRSLTERQIQKALAEGKLDKLPGAGKPLPDRPEETVTDAATLAGVRIMAEAGALPEEFALKKQLSELRKAYANLTDPKERKTMMAEMAALEMRLAIAQDARRKFLK